MQNILCVSVTQLLQEKAQQGLQGRRMQHHPVQRRFVSTDSHCQGTHTFCRPVTCPTCRDSVRAKKAQSQSSHGTSPIRNNLKTLKSQVAQESLHQTCCLQISPSSCSQCWNPHQPLGPGRFLDSMVSPDWLLNCLSLAHCSYPAPLLPLTIAVSRACATSKKQAPGPASQSTFLQGHLQVPFLD